MEWHVGHAAVPGNAFPEGLVPGAIRKYITKNFSDLKAVSICKRSGGYDVGLSDGNTHRFNLLHQYKGTVTTED